MIDLTDETFDAAVADGATVIDFWAEWCGPCKTLAPAFAEVAETHGSRALFAKVDVDDAPVLAQRYQVLSIPTILVLVDGQVAGRIVGSRSARQLREEIDLLLT